MVNCDGCSDCKTECQEKEENCEVEVIEVKTFDEDDGYCD